MSAVPKPRLLTEEEYLRIERDAERKSEFWRGEMFLMSGASRAHNLITCNLQSPIHSHLRHKDCEVYQADMRVRISSDLYTYPDVVVACGKPRFLDDELDTLLNPLVLIEVLSESTREHDLFFKAQQYRRLPSLKELVLVDQKKPLVECYARDRASPWKISTTAGLDATLSLVSIGCKIPFAEVYAKVKFPRGWEKELAKAIDVG